MEKKICGARLRGGKGICRKPAGCGTIHPGEGRCYLHGGNSAPDDAVVVLRLAADPEINERALEYLASPDLLNLNSVLAVLRARYDLIARKEDDSDALTLARLATSIVNTARTIQELELARRHYLHVSVTANIISAFSELAHRYITDPRQRERFAVELEAKLIEALRARHARVIAARAISPFEKSLELEKPQPEKTEFASWAEFLMQNAE